MGIQQKTVFWTRTRRTKKREYSGSSSYSPIRAMLKKTLFCILLLVVAASGCCPGCDRYISLGKHSSGFQHPARVLFDVAREGHKCVTWELLLKHTAAEDTWPISHDELHALFDEIDSDNDTCVTWKEVDSYDGWTA